MIFQKNKMITTWYFINRTVNPNKPSPNYAQIFLENQ